MAKPVAITDSSFQTDVLNADGAVLVDFWAAWCGPCRMIAPHLDAIADEYDGSLTVAKMDIDANPATPGQYQVFSIPTLMVFKDGEVVKRITGARPKEAIMAEVLPFMDAPAVASDDLTKIEGVGPKTAEALSAAGIKTFKDVCDAGADKLQAVVSGASLSANAGSWADQAKLAADGNWDALKTLQDQLDGGV